MGFQPATIDSGDYLMAQKPIFGGEIEVYVSSEQAYPLSSVYYDGAVTNSGVETADEHNTYSVVCGNAGADLAVVVMEEFTADAEVTMNFAGTDQNGAALTGTVVAKPPGYAANRTWAFMEGCAWDIVPAADTIGTTFAKKWRTCGYNNGISGGNVSAKSGFRIMKLPARSTFRQIGCTTKADFGAPIHPAISIPCGMNGTKYVKPGRTEQSTFSISYKDAGFMDGLARLGNRYCTILLETNKESQLVTQRVYLCNARFSIKPSSGDGNDEATVTAEGNYEHLAFFWAL